MVKQQNYELYTLTATYGQRPERRELACAKKLSEWLGSRELRIVDLRFLRDFGGSALFEDEKLTPANNDREYVPFRNTVLLSIGVAWAEAMNGNAVSIGSNADDVYCPDNTMDYVGAMQQVVFHGSKKKDIQILAPLREHGYGKVEIVKIGMKLGFPFEHTWACFNSDEEACGECNNCINRYLAFKKAGFTDPLSYTVIPKVDLTKRVIV